MSVVQCYINDCEIRGLCVETIRLYKMHLNAWIEFAGFPGDGTKWLEYRRRFPNLRTRDIVFRTIRAFIRWALKEGLCTEDWISKLRAKCPAAAKEPILKRGEFDRIIKAIPFKKDGRRDKALYTLLFYTLARRDAIRLLRWKDVDLKEGSIRIKTKGNIEQTIPLIKPAMLALNSWRAHCPSEEWCFPSIRHPKQPVNARHVSRRIHLYAKAAGIERRVHVHLLRHSGASALNEAGVPVTVIQAILGHSSVSTTINYLRSLPQSALRDALEKVFA